MHLRSVLIKTYPLTRNRIKFTPKKSTERIKFVFNLYERDNTTEGSYKNFYKPMELKDPARGKHCQHYEFADLRLFYRNKKYAVNGFTHEQYYVCPICGDAIRDGDLIYLKEMLVVVKYLNHLMEDSNNKNDSMMMFGEEEISKNRAERSSALIIITHIEKKVYVQYNCQSSEKNGRVVKEVEGLYKTMVDPYINFSEYSLGIGRNVRKMKGYFNFDEDEQDSESEKL